MRWDRINVYFDQAEAAALRTLALTNNQSASSMTRRAVRYMLRNPRLFLPPDLSETTAREFDCRMEDTDEPPSGRSA